MANYAPRLSRSILVPATRLFLKFLNRPSPGRKSFCTLFTYVPKEQQVQATAAQQKAVQGPNSHTVQQNCPETGRAIRFCPTSTQTHGSRVPQRHRRLDAPHPIRIRAFERSKKKKYPLFPWSRRTAVFGEWQLRLSPLTLRPSLPARPPLVSAGRSREHRPSDPRYRHCSGLQHIVGSGWFEIRFLRVTQLPMK